MTVEYKVIIRTSSKLGAGTDAPISVVLAGTNGEREPHTLDKRFLNDFDAGGVGGDWLLDSVQVSARGKSWYFPYFRWVLGHSTAD